ncbi:hypothetical protein IDJ77_17640 [Mucilaginibacter sp. ZT4R22]|uniref:Uncharacterized protein n=1 Tax=Mucilaginibacter pankratovii TaxID=2772110 RepID=A0ABR7WWJ4_9SPHI|nr:hypothetical protein [Mucilaginibacter pankratovii]MBD1365642.1 hypothetical protein [Mucilaginibacter pankratovii]
MKVHNKSKEIITVEYADRELPEMNNVGHTIAGYKAIMPDSTKDIVKSGRDDAWHDYIDRGPSKKLFVYIFSVKEISQHQDNVVGDVVIDGKYLKRFEYTEQELISRNWVIDYEQEK